MLAINRQGVSLYLTIVLLSVLTGGLLAVVSVNLSQTRVVSTIGDSVISFYAADTGVEKLLYEIYQEGYIPSTGDCPFTGTLGETDAPYEICVSSNSSTTVWSRGEFERGGEKTFRRIQLNFVR